MRSVFGTFRDSMMCGVLLSATLACGGWNQTSCAQSNGPTSVRKGLGLTHASLEDIPAGSVMYNIMEFGVVFAPHRFPHLAGPVRRAAVIGSDRPVPRQWSQMRVSNSTADTAHRLDWWPRRKAGVQVPQLSMQETDALRYNGIATCSQRA